MTITLPCNCKIHEDGKFELGPNCVNCRECNFVKDLHPFGTKRL